MTSNGHSNGSNGHTTPEARWKKLGAQLDEMMRRQTWENLRNLDPLKTVVWTVGALLGVSAWLFLIWLVISWLT